MTACNETQSASFGKKVVGTALAGTLAVGMVPAAALAAPADAAAANDGIETLAMTPVQDFNGGKVTGVTVDGSSADAANVTLKVSQVKETKEANGSDPAEYSVPVSVTQVTTGMGTVLNLKSADVTVKYAEAVEGTQPKDMDPSAWTTYFPSNEAGTYYAQVTVNKGLADDNPVAPYADGVVYLTITVTGDALTGITAYEIQNDAANLSDTTFNYTASAQKIGFKLNGEKLVEGTDYEVQYFGTDGKPVSQTPAGSGASAQNVPVNAGTYTAQITGKGDYSGTRTSVTITVNKLNLSTAAIVIPPVTTSDTEIALGTINGVDAKSLAVKTSISPDFTAEKGSYAVTVEPADTAAMANIEGSQVVNVACVAKDEIYWSYNGTLGADANDAPDTIPTVYNPSDSQKSTALDLSKLIAYNTGTTPAEDDELPYTVKVVNKATGEAATVDSLTKPGVWTVICTVNSADASVDYTYGGSLTFDYTVYAGNITAADVIVMQDGKVTSQPTFTYDGTNVLPKIDLTVKSGKTTLVEGTDYTLKVTDSNSAEVSEAINQGTYTVTIDAPGYNFVDATGNPAQTFTVKVNAIEIQELRVANQVKNATGTPAEFIPYTGSDITPVIEYATKAKPATGEDDRTWTVLPADLYSVAYDFTAQGESSSQTVTALNGIGSYDLTVTMNNTPEGKNYTFASGTTDPVNELKVAVAKGGQKFQDVPSTQWFYDAVNEAASTITDANGKVISPAYMNGYAGTDLFGPNDKITRGQVACVLFNMAGGKAGGAADDSFDDNSGFKTGFSDVDDHAYYAQAIAWAKQAGVVNGYAGTDKFGPNDFVTREQFAAMLANYAKAAGKFVAVEDIAAVLDARPDGSAVSAWAKESVAWAVSNKYMGNAADGVINPLGNITRAEVAAMAVNYQPKPEQA